LQRLAGGTTSELNAWLDAKADGALRPDQSEPLDKVLQLLQQAMRWDVRPNLLDSDGEDRHVVLEVDNDRRGQLRFGDGELGRRPADGESFWVRYRVGSGPAGNVGADKVTHLVYRSQPVTGVTRVRNPLAAQGGRSPETLRHAKLMAPSQFRKPRRAVLADDYASLARTELPDRVQAAAATLDWTGGWFEVAVAVDAFDGVNIERLLSDVERKLQQYRRMGHRLRVQRPIDVPLDIALTVCVTDGYLRAHVQRDLLLAFSNRELPSGGKGFFHPDNVAFGQPIFLSRVVREARRIAGVENVSVTKFQRLGQGDNGELNDGLMTFGPFEVPRLDNDGRAPHLGRLCLNMRGAR
jgi:predicted phage baseplate assembly protein